MANLPAAFRRRIRASFSLALLKFSCADMCDFWLNLLRILV
ncbi:hypothetical protein CAMRE0001_0417 [Campylobacter rectus RM3267]|uniref:Uncharacterized protein n=1 Tax=Campylobacter rectus RM3267 TaxID=553218 RepID=B9D2I4_CAMRE|nr:hypothetical protein CAMRE0001_0417 [Campylobacter rectus RM3267]